ncbi:MAG: hypothetical protein AB8G22_16165 [Saprospiraceae bacterium]
MEEISVALKRKKFRWRFVHLNHIAENIVFKKRNVSFLAINALFRMKKELVKVERDDVFRDSYKIIGSVPVQKNDLLRIKQDKMTAVFRVDKHDNIMVVTVYSESDEYKK